MIKPLHRSFLIFIILHICSSIDAQNNQQKIDSLLDLIEFTDVNTTKFYAYKNIYNILKTTHPDSARVYGELAIDHARGINWPEGQFHILRYMGDDLTQSSPNIANNMAVKALQIAHSLNTDSLKSEAYSLIGRTYYMRQSYDSAQLYLDSSEWLEQEIQNKVVQSANYNALGLINYQRAKHPEALRYFEQYLAIVENLDNEVRHINALNLISIIYQRMGNESRAIEYGKRALTLAEKAKNERRAIRVHNNLATCYYKLSDYNNALKHYNKASELIKKHGGNPLHSAGININMANIYNDQKEYQSALNSLNKGIKLLEGRDSHPFYAGAILSKGSILSQVGRPREGIALLEQALSLARKNESAKAERNALKRLSQAFEKLNNHEKAFDYYTEFIAARDSFANKEDIEQITQTRLEFQFAKEKLADSLANQQQQEIKDLQISEQEAQLSKQRNQRWALIGGLGLLGLLAASMFRANRNKTKANKIIAQEKEEAEKQRLRAEQSEQFKERFLANMSHEIRTPMHAISGMTNILKRNPHPTTQEPFLDAMQQSSRNLLVILNDILDLSKIEAGKIDIQSIPFNLKGVINHVYNLLKNRATEKGLEFNLDIDASLPEFIVGDPQRLSQVVINLIGNAIKFTETGSVKLSLKKENTQLQIAVSDTGIGIARENMDRIFGFFEQLQTDMATSGTGLGLNISKQLIELQQGRIWAESKVGQGSTFFVELPLRESSTHAIDDQVTDEQVNIWASALTGSRILLVEDDPFNVMVASDDLKYYINDVHIDVAMNGQEAVEKASSDSYDVILMDIDMPIMDGHEASKILRKNNGNSQTAIPIIAMTASLLKSEIQKCHDSGMNDYVPKPYEIAQLIGVLYQNTNKFNTKHLS